MEEEILRRRLQEIHSGSDLPTQPYDGQIFETTHETAAGPPSLYIYANGAWGVINVRTMAGAEALIKGIVDTWAQAGNTDLIPTSKIDLEAIKANVIARTDELYASPQDNPFPARHVIQPSGYKRGRVQMQSHTGGLPIRIGVTFPSFVQRSWNPPPGESNHGYTREYASVGQGALTPPFITRMLYYPDTHYQRNLNDRYRFYLKSPFDVNTTPTHLGVANSETGAVTRLAIAEDIRHEWTSDKVGVAGLRIPPSGRRVFFTLYNAMGEELILNEDEVGQGYVEAEKLVGPGRLWHFNQGNNLAQIENLGDTTWANPGNWNQALSISSIPDNVYLWFRFILKRGQADSRTLWLSSRPILSDDFKSLPDITSDGETAYQVDTLHGTPQNINVDNDPNSYLLRIDGIDNMYVGRRAGLLTFHSDHIAYWRYAHADLELWYVGVRD